MIGRALVLALAAQSLLAYTEGVDVPGEPPARHTTPGDIVFTVDSSAAAGVVNDAGQTLITTDSDPVAAIRAAGESWNRISDSTVNFGRFDLRSAQVSASSDRENVVTFADNATTRSLVGDATAVTSFFVLPSSNTIIESDVVFNPDIRDEDGLHIPFSTTGEAGTFDIESTLTHEFGHVIGAKHSSVGGSTMWQNGREGELFPRTLTPDDEMFAIQAYPQPGALNRYGRIRGNARLGGGGPLRGGLIAAVDPNGAVISALTDLITGAYEILVPPGEYLVYADPANGPLGSTGLTISDGFLDNAFATTLFGGNDAPSTIAVGAGGIANVDITAPNGAPPLEIELVGARDGGFIVLGTGPREVPVNETSELFFWGAGLAEVQEQDIRILGPELELVPGTVRISQSLEFRGFPALRFFVRPTPAANPSQSAGGGSLGTVLITRQGIAAAYTGGIVVENLLAPGPTPVFSDGSVTNAASFAPGPVAPGELISIFGTDLGPATPATAGSFGSDGLLPSTLSDVQVSFDGQPAPLFFVSASQINVQVPYGVAGRATTTAAVNFQGRFSSNVTLPVADAVPGVFFLAPGAPAILNQDGSQNTPANPEARGRAVVVFVTGLGAVTPAVATGAPAPASPLSGITEVSATMGGRPAQPLFAGLTPGFVGLAQVNLLVPEDVPAGAEVPLSISLRGRPIQGGVTVAVAE